VESVITIAWRRSMGGRLHIRKRADSRSRNSHADPDSRSQFPRGPAGSFRLFHEFLEHFRRPAIRIGPCCLGTMRAGTRVAGVNVKGRSDGHRHVFLLNEHPYGECPASCPKEAVTRLFAGRAGAAVSA
jgi:hypothetical protein